MNCPKCFSRSKIASTQSSSREVLRYRVCDNEHCLHPFETIEIRREHAMHQKLPEVAGRLEAIASQLLYEANVLDNGAKL